MTILTRRALLRMKAGKPKGFLLLARLLTEIEEGKLQRTAAVTELEPLLRRIVDEDEDAVEVLRLKFRRGEKPSLSMADVEKRTGKVTGYIWSELEKIDPDKRVLPRGSLAPVIAKAARKFHKSPRSIERAWNELTAHTYKFMRENRWAVALTKQQLTPDEWECLKEAPGAVGVAVAFARQRGRPLAKTFDEEVRIAVAKTTRK